jgi:hypothetical protein
MKRVERERINSYFEQRNKYQQQKMQLLLELEIDEVTKAEADAINKIKHNLERKLSSPKRKTAIETLKAEAELTVQSIKTKTMQKIQRLKSRYGV